MSNRIEELRAQQHERNKDHPTHLYGDSVSRERARRQAEEALTEALSIAEEFERTGAQVLKECSQLAGALQAIAAERDEARHIAEKAMAFIQSLADREKDTLESLHVSIYNEHLAKDCRAFLEGLEAKRVIDPSAKCNCGHSFRFHTWGSTYCGQCQCEKFEEAK